MHGPGSRPAAARIAVVLLACLLAAGCISPERRYRLLSFLFDGVPRPGAVAPAEPEALTAEAEKAEQRREARVRPATPVLFRHEPDCDECHNGGKGANSLGLPREELCWECHDEDDFQGAFVHGPVAAGQCVGCHNPHKSRFANLLLAEAASICARCHEAATDPGPGGHRAARGDDCLGCHNPHAGEREYMLRAGAP